MHNKICLVSTVRTSLENTLAFINYHLNIGIDLLYIFFDDPNDISIRTLVNNKNVLCFKCNSKHWDKLTKKKNLSIEERQRLNANMALLDSRKKDCKWIVHLDSDELIYSKKSLKVSLSNIPKDTDVLRLRTMEAVPEKLDSKNPFKNSTLFKNMGQLSKVYYSHKKLLQKIIPLLKKREGTLAGIYFRGHAAGKSIVRTDSNIKDIGIHEPISKDGSKLNYQFVSDMHLLHFDSCSFKNWETKLLRRLDGTATAKEIGGNQIKMLKEFSTAYKTCNKNIIRNLYKKQYFMPRVKKLIFKQIGLLKQINLNVKLFDSPQYLKEN